MEVPLDAWNFESHLEEFLPLHGKVLALPPQPPCLALPWGVALTGRGAQRTHLRAAKSLVLSGIFGEMKTPEADSSAVAAKKKGRSSALSLASLLLFSKSPMGCRGTCLCPIRYFHSACLIAARAQIFPAPSQEELEPSSGKQMGEIGWDIRLRSHAVREVMQLNGNSICCCWA